MAKNNNKTKPEEISPIEITDDNGVMKVIKDDGSENNKENEFIVANADNEIEKVEVEFVTDPKRHRNIGGVCEYCGVKQEKCPINPLVTK